jgi:hypothetical protein
MAGALGLEAKVNRLYVLFSDLDLHLASVDFVQATFKFSIKFLHASVGLLGSNKCIKIIADFI